MTLYWQNYEGRSLIQTTLRFLPLCVVGVITNMIGSACVAIVVSWDLLRPPFTSSSLTVASAVWANDATNWRYRYCYCGIAVCSSPTLLYL